MSCLLGFDWCRYERTWLMVHEPIRIALVDIEDLVSASNLTEHAW